MKIGIDYHGVITANPSLFSMLTKILLCLNYEVHIITGSRITETLKECLSEYGISYSHLFSISDYHFQIGTPMVGYEDHQPKIVDEIWDRTKAEYCLKNNIILHIDDSDVYWKYFSTPYALFSQTKGNPSISFPLRYGDLKTVCTVCGEKQFITPSGTTCTNGHGDAPPLTVEEYLQKHSRPLKPEFMDVVNKKLPDLLG